MDRAGTDPSDLAQGAILTERQISVLRRRARGDTQRAIAEEFGTTASNVSRIERAAERNIEKARRTLEVARLIRAPIRVTVEEGTEFDDMVEAIYDRGDEAGITIDYCRPELYAHLYTHLHEIAADNQFVEPVTVGVSEAGDVNIVDVGTE